MGDAVAHGTVPQELADKLLASGGQEHFREAAAEAWAGGLKQFVYAQRARMRATGSEPNTHKPPPGC